MNLEECFTAEISEANLSYLILAQRIIKHDRILGILQLGISTAVADLIEQLTPYQMFRIAASNFLICRFHFENEKIWQLLLEEATKSPDNKSGKAFLHSKILISTQRQETILSKS